MSASAEVLAADAFWQLLTVLFAPFWGSFLALFVRRWPAGVPVVTGRSRCEACKRTLAAGDLVPLFSWLRLKGRCRHCGAAIGLESPVFELAMLILALVVVPAAEPSGVRAFLWLVAGGLLLAVGVIDARHLTIPTAAVAVVGLLGLADGLIARTVLSSFPDPSIPDRMLGVFVGYGTMALLRHAYRRLRGREGLGGGDPLLMAALGAWLGWQTLPMALLLAAVTGLAFVLARGLLHRRWPRGSDMLAFGPFLIAGGLGALAWRLVGG